MSLLCFLLLLAAAAGWFALPLLPAFREFLHPTDTDPLSVVGRDAGDVAFFAKGFREYLGRQRLAEGSGSSGGGAEGRLPDGTPLFRVAPGTWARPGAVVDAVVVSQGAWQGAGGETFLREFHAEGAFWGGEGATYRAVLGEGDVRLGGRSVVLRWIHSEGQLEVAPGTSLRGRASSATCLRLAEGVSFERVGAPRIVVGEGSVDGQEASTSTPEAWIPPRPRREIGVHRWFQGTLDVPGLRKVDGHLIVQKSLSMGPHCVVEGSLKAGKDVSLGEGTQVEGSVVARRSVVIGAGCRVSGPVVAEGSVVVGRGAVIGSATELTTVTAPRVVLQAGAVVFGVVAAQAAGITEG